MIGGVLPRAHDVQQCAFVVQPTCETDGTGLAVVVGRKGGHQRRMSGQVGDREQVGGEAGVDDQIDRLQHLVHRLTQLRPCTLRVDVLDRRDQARVAEEVGPGEALLHDELIVQAVAREGVEGGGGLGAQGQQHPARRTARDLDLDELMAQVLELLQQIVQRCAGLQRAFRVTDARTHTTQVEGTHERTIQGGRILAVRPDQHLQDQPRVVRRATDRPDLVHRPRQDHGTRARHATERRAQTGHAALHARGDDRAQGLGPDGKGQRAR